MKGRAIFVALLISYAAVILPFSRYMKERPVILKLGYLPSARVMGVVAGDQRYLAAESYVVKVLFYFGDLLGRERERLKLSPEYFNMFKTVENAVILDPYNIDTYYFAQAAFTWELGRIGEVNSLLRHGMKYRDWDFSLPFYVGFNSAYFLKDYTKAAPYMQRAAELSGNPLYTTLAARYFYEAGENDLGIAYLRSMVKGARDPDVKKVYERRLKALESVRTLSDAVSRFQAARNRMPRDLRELTAAGFVRDIPADPYGGRFYLDRQGKVRSTSKFAMKE